jgi:hypothetical protein
MGLTAMEEERSSSYRGLASDEARIEAVRSWFENVPLPAEIVSRILEREDLERLEELLDPTRDLGVKRA